MAKTSKAVQRDIKPENLTLDTRNPRFVEVEEPSQHALINLMWNEFKASEIANLIATQGYFLTEPLLAVQEDGRTVVLEGNRRLAAIRALRDPMILDRSGKRRTAQQLAAEVGAGAIDKIPVVIVPTREHAYATMAAKHVSSRTEKWTKPAQSKFIVDLLKQGYDTDRVAQFGFTLDDIRDARQTIALIDIADSIDLESDIREKLRGKKITSTLSRIFDSPEGRAAMGVKRSTEHGFEGVTSKTAFRRAYTKVISDIATGEVDTRKLNKKEGIAAYFASWKPADRPTAKGKFIPNDLVDPNRKRATTFIEAKPSPPRSTPVSRYAIPSSFKVRRTWPKVQKLHRELRKLDPVKFPHASAMVMRAFVEISLVEYLRHTKDLNKLKDDPKVPSPHGIPGMEHLVKAIRPHAQRNLDAEDLKAFERAASKDGTMLVNLDTMNAYTHRPKDLANADELRTFWTRIEPLMEMLLFDDLPEVQKSATR